MEPSEVNCCHASHVRACHAGAVNRVLGRGAGVPGGGDGRAGGEDVDALAVVGEVGAAVGRVGGADGDRTVSGGRGGQACVAIVIARSHDDGDTSSLGSVDRGVHGRAVAAAQAHGRDCWPGGIEGCLFHDPVEAREDARVAARATAVEHADGMKGSTAGDAVEVASGGAGAVGAMTVAVCPTVSITNEVP
jgi:hypothetical protein